jgi:NADH:ubiquinone oxidoreductase subunit 3 (subunit A)
MIKILIIIVLACLIIYLMMLFGRLIDKDRKAIKDSRERQSRLKDNKL